MIKKSILLLLSVCVLLTLCSCGNSKGPKGKYYCTQGGVTIGYVEFSGKNVTLAIGMGDKNDVVRKGIFTYKDGKVECSWEDEKSDTFTYDEENDSLDWFGILSFTKK